MDEAQDFTVLRNRQVTLECKSDAVPPPVIMWLKNREQLQVSLPCDSADLFLRGKSS
jgi:hemicentin